MERGVKTFFKCISLYLGLSLIFIIFFIAMQYLTMPIVAAIGSNADLFLVADIIVGIISFSFGAFFITKIERLEFPQMYDYIGKALCLIPILIALFV